MATQPPHKAAVRTAAQEQQHRNRVLQQKNKPAVAHNCSHRCLLCNQWQLWWGLPQTRVRLQNSRRMGQRLLLRLAANPLLQPCP